METEGKLILMFLVFCAVILLAGCKFREPNPYTSIIKEIIFYDKNDRRKSAEDSRPTR